MADIFISYSSHDRPSALALVTKLRDAGYDVWIDQHQLNAATRWSKEIVHAINNCKIFAVLLSPSSLKSENVRKELSLAGERHKQLLPIFIEKVALPDEFAYHLTGLQRVFIENTDAIVAAVAVMQSGSKRGDRIPNQPRTDTQSDTGGVRLAVLPFDDLSPAKDNEWFADGMVDELINTLGALDTMKVPSRTDVMYYKKHHPKAQEIANDLNVRYLVGGSVRKAGEKIRITASLTDTQANQQLWTSSYDGTFDDVFVFQETVAKQIADALNLKLSPQEVKTIADQPTHNPEAYELYLRGLEAHRQLTRAGYEQALALYEQAISIDPKFDVAYLMSASACAIFYRECSRELKWLKRAEDNLQKAKNITGETAKTLWIQGEIEWLEEDIVAAEATLRKSIELDPHNELPYSYLGNIYSASNNYKDALTQFEKALAIHEQSSTHFNVLVCLGELDEPTRLVEQAEIAILFFEKELKKDPSSIQLRMMLAYAYHWSGNSEMAHNELQILEKREDLGGMLMFNLGGLYNLLGKPDENIMMIERAVENGFREIESIRNCTFENDKHSAKLKAIIIHLEQIIENERLDD